MNKKILALLVILLVVMTTFVAVSSADEEVASIDPPRVVESYPIQDNDHISCDFWAACYEGEICVYNPEAVWADGITKGNYVCQDKDVYLYDLKPCPYDSKLQCAWEKK